MICNSIKPDTTKMLLDIKEQFCSKKNQSSEGEPQAFILFKNGRYLKVTCEKNQSDNAQSYYEWQLYCSPEELSTQKLNNIHGRITKYVSTSLNKEECINILQSIKFVVNIMF